jgi:hypothetical protein
MKFIPEAVTRKVAEQVLLTQKHSPTILFGAGVVGMLSSTVLACRATLKVEAVLDEVQSDLGKTKSAKSTVDSRAEAGDPLVNSEGDEVTYTDDEVRKDTFIIYTRGATNLVKLYAPAVLVGAASIFALTKSHSILQDRTLQLTAAYAAVDGAFKKYRQRVVDKYGEEEDRLLRYESESVEIIDDETGEIVSTVRVAPEAGSQYARWFDYESSPNWDVHPEYSMMFLRHQQNYFNDVLHARGHVFLNEVYHGLGLSHTRPGAVVGWIRHQGDNCIDFGLWDNHDQVIDFFNGRDGAILLDFNVDGVIYDKIDESTEAQQWKA